MTAIILIFILGQLRPIYLFRADTSLLIHAFDGRQHQHSRLLSIFEYTLHYLDSVVTRKSNAIYDEPIF